MEMARWGAEGRQVRSEKGLGDGVVCLYAGVKMCAVRKFLLESHTEKEER